MKLWLLKPVDDLKNDDNPWKPWYDKAFGFVVRAETEEEARRFAQDNAGDEACSEFIGEKTSNTNTPWLDAKYSTCTELLPDGEPGMVMRDFAAA